MKKSLNSLIIAVFLIIGLGWYLSSAVKAATLQDAFQGQLNTVGSRSGFNTNQRNVEPIIGTVMSVALSFLGVIFLILMIFGGFLWMTAAGNDEKVKRAVQLIQAAILGLVIVVGAYAITVFILGRISKDLIPIGESGGISGGSYDGSSKSSSSGGNFCCVLYSTPAPVRTISGCTPYTEDNATNRDACAGSGDSEFLSSACPSGCPNAKKLGCCVFTNVPLDTACVASPDSATCLRDHPNGTFNSEECSPSLGCPP